jgi:hypothetical protein
MSLEVHLNVCVFVRPRLRGRRVSFLINPLLRTFTDLLRGPLTSSSARDRARLVFFGSPCGEKNGGF